MRKYETTQDFARAVRIEQVVLRDYLEDVDAADVALDELMQNSDRTDAVIARVVAMRIAQA